MGNKFWCARLHLDFRLISDLVGSTPVERTKIKGVLFVESSKTWPKSRTGGSTNFKPEMDNHETKIMNLHHHYKYLMISIAARSLQRTQVVDDERGGAERDAIGTQRPHDQHSLQLVALIVPPTFKWRGEVWALREKLITRRGRKSDASSHL